MGIHYQQLDAEERGTITAMILDSASTRRVAEVIGRSPSTVQRKWGRNGYQLDETAPAQAVQQELD